MNKKLQSLHSEVNDEFVSNPFPRRGDRVKIRLQMSRDLIPRRVDIRFLEDGGINQKEMTKTPEEDPFCYYEADIPVNQSMVHYSFQIKMEEGIYYYNRQGISTFPPTEDRDFVILADFDNPDWVPSAVFYQIFPDRFANGAPENNVQPGEYTFDGHPTLNQPWEAPPLEYAEGFCLDFYNGDLPGIQQKIPYLKKLGVTALYLNPIFQGKTTHRYDCTDYFHVDEHLGGDQALIDLTEALHQENMKIMVDVSINHTGIEHKWFKKAQEDPSGEEANYYYREEKGDFAYWMGVKTLPQLNYGNSALRKVIYEGENSLVRKFTKKPFCIDGWRFDVGNVTARRRKDQFGPEVFRAIRRQVKDVNPRAYIIGEHWEDFISYVLGDQWDAAMNYFAVSRPLRMFLGEQDLYVDGHGAPVSAGRPISGTELSAMIHQHFDRIPNPLIFLQFNLIDSHDIHRLHNHKAVFNEDIYKGLLFLQFVLPGTPSIYYGDEIALEGHCHSVEGCRYPMPWQNEDRWNKTWFERYQKLCRLKRESPALHYGSFRTLYSDEDTLVFCRFYKEHTVLAVINRCPEKKTICLTPAVLADQSLKELFSGKEISIEKGELPLPLDARENCLFSGTAFPVTG